MNKISISFLILSLFSLGVSAQKNAASFPLNFDQCYTILHSNAKVDITLRNEGSAEISSIAYTVEDINSGSVSSEKTITLSSAIPKGEDGVATFKVPAGSSVGVCQKSVTITKVNGSVNEMSRIKASAVGTVCTLSEKMPKKTIEEEYTGTWCGWCPRGTVGIEQLRERYPDTYIAAAFHYSDEFWFAQEGQHSGFPECVLNRHLNVDPYYGSTGSEPMGIEKDYLREQSILPYASLNMKATWADNRKMKINVRSEMKFVYNTDDEFALYFIITEDGRTGSTQSNYYAGSSNYAGDPYLESWYRGVATNTYNHVVVAFAGRDNGVDGTVTSPVSVGMEQSNDYTFDLSFVDTIKDKNNLTMIVCLIDRATGTIINTDFGEIKSDESTPLPSLSDDTSSQQPSVLFSPDGKRLSSHSKGINILRHADGTIKKVINK